MMQNFSTGCQAHFGNTFIGSEIQRFSSRDSELGIITATHYIHTDFWKIGTVAKRTFKTIDY